MIPKWRMALQQAPFAGEVRESSKYIGAILAATRLEDEEEPGDWPASWSPRAMNLIAHGTWAGAGDKVEGRSSLLHVGRFPPRPQG